MISRVPSAPFSPRAHGKWLLGAGIVAAALSGAACKDDAVTAQKRRELVRVVFVGEGKDDATWPVLQATAIEFSAKNPLTRVDVLAADSISPTGQQAILRKQLESRPQSVCLCPTDPIAVRPAVDELARSGIPVVTVGRDIPASMRSVYCGPSDFDIGRTAARACSLLAPPRSRTAMLLHAGMDHPNYGGRYSGFKQALGTTGPMEVLREIDCKGDPLQAAQLVRSESRRYPRAGCWVFLDDWPLQLLPRGERLLPVGGVLILCNGSPRYFSRMADGQISAMVAYDFRQSVEDALFAAVRLGEDRNKGFGSQFTTPAEIITARDWKDYEARWQAWAEGKASPTISGPGRQ